MLEAVQFQTLSTPDALNQRAADQGSAWHAAGSWDAQGLELRTRRLRIRILPNVPSDQVSAARRPQVLRERRPKGVAFPAPRLNCSTAGASAELSMPIPL
jgi:hypothetical protein